MPTMIQNPEIAGSEVSGLTPVMREGAQSGLGSFLQGLLPAVTDEVKKYQDENRAKNIALGMNDELNKVHREVSWLDRRNYDYGHQYQFVQNGQAALQKKFSEDVNNIDISDPDAANKVFDIGRTYMASTVDNIHQSNLPTELKESLYQSTMKENAVYQQMINKKLQQLTADAEYNTRLNMTSMLTRDLLTKEFDTESLQISVETFKQKVSDGMLNSVVQVWDDGTQRFESKQPSAEDIQKETSLRLKAAFTHTLDTLKASGTGEDLQRMRQLVDVADMLIDEDLDLATYVKGKSSEFQAQVEKNNDSYKSREVEQMISSWELDPSTLNVDVLNAAIAKIAGDDSLSITARTGFINQLQGAYTSIKKSLISGKVTDVTLYESPLQYRELGKSEAEWSKDWVANTLAKHSGDPTAAGYEIMVQGGNAGGVYSGTHVQAGSEIFFKSLLGSVNMTDAEAKDDQYYQYREDSFNKAGQLYRTYKSQNGSKAIDMLSGIDEKYRYAFEAVLDNGGTLSQVREAMKSPVAINDKFKYYDTALNNITTDHLDLRSGTLGGHGGRLHRNMADALEGEYKSFFTTAARTSKSALVTRVQGESPIGFMSSVKGSLQMPSDSGYNSTITTANARKQIQGFTIAGTGEPLHETYISKAIDAQRVAIAKNYNTRPENMIITIDDQGQVQFHAYKITGDYGGITTGTAEPVNTNTSGLMSGGIVSLARIKAEAEALHKEDRTPKNTDSKLSATRVGSTVVVDKSFNSKFGVPVTINAAYVSGLGGNVDIATDWVKHMHTYEGFVGTSTRTVDQNTGKVSNVFAMGVLRKTAEAHGMLVAFEAARGNPQKLMDLQGTLVKKYYTDPALDIKTFYKRVGIPEPTASAYPEQYKDSVLLVMDSAWHGWRGSLDRPAQGRSSLLQAMNAPTYSQGLAHLKNMSNYDRKNPTGNRRNKWMEETLKKHYKALGKL